MQSKKQAIDQTSTVLLRDDKSPPNSDRIYWLQANQGISQRREKYCVKKPTRNSLDNFA